MNKNDYYSSFFNKTATNYKTKLSDDHFERMKIKLIKKYIQQNSIVLDVGISNGLLELEYAEYAKKIIGIDTSDNMLTECERILKENNIGNVESIQMNATDLRFNKDTFDLVISYSTLTYILNITQAFNEIFRVLKPGGFAILDILNRNNLSGKYWNKWHRKKGAWGQWLFSLNEIKQLLKGFDAEIIEVYSSNFTAQLKHIPIVGRFFGLFRFSKMDKYISRLFPSFAGRWYFVLQKREK